MTHRSAGFRIVARTLPPLAFWLASQGVGGGPELGTVIARAARVPAPPPPTPPPLTRVALGELLGRLQRLSFADEQLGLVRAAVQRGDYFTCAQAAQLMRASALGDDRVKIAAVLYPRLVDPEDLAQLVATLAREGDRHKLRLWIGGSAAKRDGL